jgi:hypothetical protein
VEVRYTSSEDVKSPRLFCHNDGDRDAVVESTCDQMRLVVSFVASLSLLHEIVFCHHQCPVLLMFANAQESSSEPPYD